jgi:hypothetical protein
VRAKPKRYGVSPAVIQTRHARQRTGDSCRGSNLPRQAIRREQLSSRF